MTLRPPNFLLPSDGTSNNTAATVNIGGNDRLSLSSYTSKCQQQLLLAVSKSSDDDNDEITSASDDHAKNDTNDTSHSKGNNSSREGSNEPSMEQCILLLEPHLLGFQKSCRQKEDKLQHESTGGERKMKRKKVHHATTEQQQLPTSLNDFNNREEDDTVDADDEVPPQLLRLARFFHYRWLPIKRALLRPVKQSTDIISNNEQGSTSSVEVGLKYRLRLAKACRKYGLVAAAEYEMLMASLNKV